MIVLSAVGRLLRGELEGGVCVCGESDSGVPGLWSSPNVLFGAGLKSRDSCTGEPTGDATPRFFAVVLPTLRREERGELESFCSMDTEGLVFVTYKGGGPHSPRRSCRLVGWR